MASKIGEIIASAVVPILANVGKDKLVEVLDKLKEQNESTYKTTIISLYPIVDLQLEGVTDKTKTNIDDLFVDALKGAIEESAAKNGLVLQNLDQD
jgi:hypothetical protein